MSTSAPRIAANKAVHRETGANNSAPGSKRLQCIDRTGRLKPAAGP